MRCLRLRFAPYHVKRHCILLVSHFVSFLSCNSLIFHAFFSKLAVELAEVVSHVGNAFGKRRSQNIEE